MSGTETESIACYCSGCVKLRGNRNCVKTPQQIISHISLVICSPNILWFRKSCSMSSYGAAFIICIEVLLRNVSLVPALLGTTQAERTFALHSLRSKQLSQCELYLEAKVSHPQRWKLIRAPCILTFENSWQKKKKICLLYVYEEAVFT